MRLAFFLLVLVNLLFFSWAQGYWGGREDGREPQRLGEQLQPQKIKVALPAPAAATACRLVAGVAAKDVEPLTKAIQEAGLAALAKYDEEAPSFWVNIPALPNRAAADKKAGELKLLGVGDFHVMQGENGSFVISLGVFRSESGANEFLAGLNRKGVKSARLEMRRAPAAARIEIRGVAAVVAQRLPELLAAASGATAADCP